jgi:DNA recombination protein RmuC
MITTILLAVLIVLVIVNLIVTLTKKISVNNDDILAKLNGINSDVSKIDSLIRDEFRENRKESLDAFKNNREELNNSFKLLGENLSKTVTDLSNAQKNQFDTFSQQLNNFAKLFDDKIKNLIEQSENFAKSNRSELNNSFKLLGENLTKTLTDLSNAQRNQFESYSNRLAELTKLFDDKTKSLQEQLEKSAKDNRAEQTNSLKSFEDKFTQNVKDFNELQKQKFDDLSNKQDNIKKETENKLKEIRETVENKLTTLQEDNNKKLEEMRKTVDEKLQESINKRFNESFELISKRLEEVQKGLGEMQTLASDVGGLKKVLTNVKTRGTFGEVQLESLLEQIFSPEQYETQVAVTKNGQERVDAVVKLPGQTDDNSALLLPIDSKFPVEDYQRLYDAYDTGETKEIILGLRKKFEDAVKITAKSIAAKYINPPVTTDFAIMFVPSEGIYAEILRSVELFESLRRDFRITIVGPTNLAAFLSSLQMGFRTLAIQKRTSEVWSILGAVKTEFGKFGDVLDKASNQLQTVAKSITNAGARTRAIERKLRGVESLPQEQSAAMLSDVVEIDQDENIEENAVE